MVILEEFFHSGQLLLKIFQLYKDAAQPSFDATTAGPQFEHLDKLCIEGMHLAEKHCWKLYMSPGFLPYLDTLVQPENPLEPHPQTTHWRHGNSLSHPQISTLLWDCKPLVCFC